MSKNIGTALKAHLAQSVTTLAMCWRIVRTDGATYGFTTLDKDLTVGGVLYRSTAGFSSTNIQSGSTGAVDNLQVMGFLSDGPGGIAYKDVKNQLFDYATVYLFAVNWRSTSMGQINLRRGWLGETVLATNGAFLAELRGLTQALVQEVGNFYSPLCRNDLGDNNCKVPILPGIWGANVQYYVGDYVRAQTQPDDVYKTAIFQAQKTAHSWTAEPTWNAAEGGTTNDGDQVWVSKPPYRRIAAVVTPQDQHNFISTALTVPTSASGTGATIAIIESVSAGTALEITDGINTYTFATPYDLRAGESLYYLFNGLVTSSLNMTYTPLFMTSGTAYGIGLVNNSGVQGSISKTGDFLGSIVIDNFGGTGKMDGGVLSWISGDNAGVSMEIKTYAEGGSQLTLYLGMNMPIQAGDRFWYYPGCDKRRDTCVKKYNNIRNNRSEPDIPGIDKLLAYPDE